MFVYLQETRFANPSLHDLVPFEHGPAPGPRRQGQRDVEPLQLGGSKQPTSDATEDALTQNWVGPQVLHGSFDSGAPLSVGVEPASVAAVPQPSMPAHELAPTTHFLVASEKPEQLDSHEGGVEPQLLAIDAQTSAHDVDAVVVSESVPLEPLHATRSVMANEPRSGLSFVFMREAFARSSRFTA